MATVQKSQKSTALQSAPEIELTLRDFCIRLSTKEKRVELISGFEADERRANRLKASESEFDERFKAFINRPA
jgi:hypothetical protein